ncbi:MAG: hypothetical protein Q8R70_13515 [Methanoregula sp.]|nr:hypothetical protein [Methanoregula sp.]
MTEITINGKTFSLTGNPSHGMVREVKNSQRQLITDLIKTYKDKIQFDGSMSIQTAIGKILAENPDEFVKIENRKAEFNHTATMSLACNHLFMYEDFDNLPEKEFRTLFEKCKVALGSDAEGFFSYYEGNSSSTTSAEQKTPSGTTSPATRKKT